MQNPEQKLIDDLDISLSMASLLVNRGLDSADKVHDFFDLDIQKLHDPFLMKDMDLACERLSKAIQEKQRILLYGDYDVDGTSAVSMFLFFLKDLGLEADYYIPSKFNEGYGLSERGIAYAIETQTALIITLDCGIRGHDLIQKANDHQIDVIVCDHHKVAETIPNAHAVLNPQRDDCTYPFNGLSGCGVGFKLMQAYCINHQLPLESIYQHLDLLAISTSCDIVPMLDENRVLVHEGLKRLVNTEKVGVKHLLKLTKLSPPFHVSDIVFKVGPRMNAAGRIAHANLVVKLLTETVDEEARQLAQYIDDLNTKRKMYDQQCTEEALQIIAEMGELDAYVLYKADWHKGVLGIVAARCVESSGKAVIILTESNGEATGSARAPQNVHLYNAISSCDHLLSRFGGHKAAAGLSLPIDQLESFREQLSNNIQKSIIKAEASNNRVDLQLSVNDIDQDLLNLIQTMRPFGPGNLEPVFESVSIQASQIKVLKNEHLSFLIKGTTFRVIAFQQADQLRLIEDNHLFMMQFKLNWNFFNGRKLIQLQSLNIRSN